MMVSTEEIIEMCEMFKREFPQNYADLTEEQKEQIFRMAVPYPEEWK